jgi:hypothetical protein
MRRILLTIQYGSIVIQYIWNAGILRRPVIDGPPFMIQGAAVSVSKSRGRKHEKGGVEER